MTKELTPLEALEIIYNLEDLQGGRDDFWNAYRVIKKALKDYKKSLEIIKNTFSIKFRTNVFFDKVCYVMEINNIYALNEVPIFLSKENYVLLKKMLL